jgi:RNA polymerase sigma-70 factor, ECF subfamily
MSRLTDNELESLYRRYGYLVHRRCLTLLGTAAEAEDATQEVFLRAYERLPPDAEGYALSWLYATASHYCFDLTRKRSYRARQRETQRALASPSAPSLHGDDRTQFLWLFGELDATTREIGVMHFIDGFTQEEIEARTGISRKTIGKKLRALKERLAKAEST